MNNYIKKHFSESSAIISNLTQHQKEIISIVKLILNSKKKDKKILVAGNGGSSADSEHFTGELICTFNDRKRKPIAAVCLSNHPAAITAWSNDFSYDTYFERQVDSIGCKGDVLILLSTSGGSKVSSMNLVYAARLAKKKGMKVISLIGKSGGILKKISDIKIVVKSKMTSYIQEAHMSILHCICECLDKELK
jgi:D-sedoheptulose 7-phosphate isomerase